MQLALALNNLARACVVAKDLAQAMGAADEGAELYFEIMGPSHPHGTGLAEMANRLRSKIESDYSQGIDWRRAFTCSACGDRFPWGLHFDEAFNQGLDFLMATCHTCGAQMRIDKPAP